MAGLRGEGGGIGGQELESERREGEGAQCEGREGGGMKETQDGNKPVVLRLGRGLVALRCLCSGVDHLWRTLRSPPREESVPAPRGIPTPGKGWHTSLTLGR